MGAFARIENRRHEIDELHDGLDPSSRALARRLLDDERDVDRVVVDEEPVLLLAVIAESFAVVRHENHGRLVVELMGLQIVQQPADDLVRVGDLAVVGPVISGSLGWRVASSRFVQMQEEERAGRAHRVEPVLGDLFRIGAVPVRAADWARPDEAFHRRRT